MVGPGANPKFTAWLTGAAAAFTFFNASSQAIFDISPGENSSPIKSCRSSLYSLNCLLSSGLWLVVACGVGSAP